MSEVSVGNRCEYLVHSQSLRDETLGEKVVESRQISDRGLSVKHQPAAAGD